MKRLYFYETEAGKVGIAELDGAITDVFFRETLRPEEYELEETDLLRRAYGQLQEYFLGSRTEFDLPLGPQGTEFEQLCWQALLTIPFGETRSYKDIAEQIGRPKACRAVGRANGANPISVIIPCHRVIGSNGKLVGYGGGLPFKEKLLRLEDMQQRL